MVVSWAMEGGCSWAMGVLEKQTSGRFEKVEFRFHTIVVLI
jgi:hypothetical protein